MRNEQCLKEEMRLGSEKIWFGVPKQCDAARRDEDTADVLEADSQPVHIMKALGRVCYLAMIIFTLKL